jgi:hypothetical protein
MLMGLFSNENGFAIFILYACGLTASFPFSLKSYRLRMAALPILSDIGYSQGMTQGYR